MKNIENKQNISRFEKIIFGAMLLCICAFSASVTLVNAQSGNWRLETVHVDNKLNKYATITSEKADATGGRVVINADGAIYDTCPGGVEQLGFVWKFEYPVSSANPGGAFGASLEAGQVSKSSNCGTYIASVSYIAMAGSSGGSSPYREDFNKLIDGERFATGNGNKAWAAEANKTTIGSVQMRSHRAYKEQPYAFFTVDIGVRGGGYIRYIYLYERSD